MKLPTQKKPLILDPAEFLWLIYGREKIGKTTLAASWPNVLFLSTEPGTKGMSVYEIPIRNWSDMIQACRALQKNRKRFSTVVIDTVDLAYEYCLDHVCRRMGIDYPGRDEKGREDYGRSWHHVRDEFVNIIHQIARSGRGIIFISHVTEGAVRTRSGSEYDRVIPSMSKQARKVVEALVDIILYAEYFRTVKGRRSVRLLMCHGDELVWAGHRKTAGKFPDLLPLKEENGYEEVLAGFLGKHPGVDPSSVMGSFHTAEAAREVVRRMATRERRKRQKAKKSKLKRVPRRVVPLRK